MTAPSAAPTLGIPSPTNAPRGRIGLTLSGGGFRATLYHLGVIRFLYEVGLLPSVSHVCSVSGGSILAAHLVLNWDRYTGTQQQFQQAADELVAFTQADLRGHVLRSWLFSLTALGLPRVLQPGAWTRNGLLQKAYDRLYGSRTLRDLNTALADGTRRPELHILATSMTTGHLVSFGRCEMRVHDGSESEGYPARPDNGQRAPHRYPADSVPIALAVAASSAFPPFFPPVRVSPATLGNAGEVLEYDHYLADGGVFDNLGIRKLLWLNREVNANFDLVVVSDAQCETARRYGKPYQFVWARAARSSDLLMNRISWFEDDAIRRLSQEAESDLLCCQLQYPVPLSRVYALSSSDQSAVQHVRTDLDAFTSHEINALVHQGTTVARSNWSEHRQAGKLTRVLGANESGLDRADCWLPIANAAKPPFQLNGSDRRKAGLFRAGDWTGWALWGLLLLYFVVAPLGVFGWLWKQAADARRERDLAQAQQRQAEAMANHVRLKETLIDLLADVTLAKSKERFEFARARWDTFTHQLLQDEIFQDWLGEDIEAINGRLQAWQPHDPKLERLTLELARKVGQWIQETQNEKYLEVLRGMRDRWYEEAVQAAETITRAEKIEDAPISRQRFWKLYWGKMCMVEDKGVESAMGEFGKVLKRWEAKKEGPAGDLKPDLTKALENLRQQCKAETGKPLPHEKPASRSAN